MDNRNAPILNFIQFFCKTDTKWIDDPDRRLRFNRSFEKLQNKLQNFNLHVHAEHSTNGNGNGKHKNSDNNHTSDISEFGEKDGIIGELLTIVNIMEREPTLQNIEQYFSPDEREALLVHLLETMPSDRLTQVLGEIGLKPEFEPLDPEIEVAIDAIIEEINANPYLPQSKRQDTVFETALKMFKERGSQGVNPDELEALVPDVEDKYTAARKLIHRLNGKLEKFNVTIQRPRHYYLVPSDKSKEK